MSLDERLRRRSVLLAAYFLAQVLLVFCASDAFLVRVDDSYYYFGVARHVVDDGRFTFDGLHLTNGFQPLWQFILIAVTRAARLFGAVEPRALLHVYFVVCAALNTASGWLALGLADQHLGEGTRASRIAAFSFFWLPGLTFSLLGGMESCVNWPLLLLFFRLLGGSDGRIALGTMARRRLAALIAVSVLLVCARLDNTVILATTVLYLWARERSAAAVKNGVLWGAATAALWGPLLLWGQRTFSSPTPVSGSVKLWNTADFIGKNGSFAYAVAVVKAFVLSVLAIPASALGMGYYEPVKPVVMRLGFSLAIGLLGVALPAFAIVAVRALRSAVRTKRERPPELLPLLATVSAVHLLTLVTLFPDQWMYAGLIWYDLVEYLCLFVLVGWIGGWLTSALSNLTWSRMTVTARVASVAALIPILAWRPSAPTEGLMKLEAARWINDHLPPSAIVASHDAGVLGYFARVPVVNLDGLVNERRYLDEYLRTGRKKDYLRDAGVTHLADIDCPKTPKARFRSLLRVPSEARIVLTLRGNEHDLDFCIVELTRAASP